MARIVYPLDTSGQPSPSVPTEVVRRCRAVSSRWASGAEHANLGVAVAAAADLLQVLADSSGRLEVRTADVPDQAAMHAWSLRLLDRGSRRRRGILRLLP